MRISYLGSTLHWSSTPCNHSKPIFNKWQISSHIEPEMHEPSHRSNRPNRSKALRSLKITECHSRFCSMSKEVPNTKSPITSKPNQLNSVPTAGNLPAATSVAICSSSILTCLKALSLYRTTAAIGFSLSTRHPEKHLTFS